MKMNNLAHSLKIVTLDKVTSTNDYASELGRKGEKEIIAVTAKTQTHGKGRHGRKWRSPPEDGLYVSFLLRPDTALAAIPILGMALTVASVKACRAIAPLTIKWPNDLMVKNRKIGGILLETETFGEKPLFVVIGLGLNLNGSRRNMIPGATSFFAETGKRYAPKFILKKIIKEFITLYDDFKNERFARIINETEKHLVTLGKRVTAKLKDTTMQGTVVGLDKSGALVIKDIHAKRKTLKAHDVMRLR